MIDAIILSKSTYYSQCKTCIYIALETIHSTGKQSRNSVIYKTIIFLLKSDCVGTCNRSKMLTAAGWSLSLEELGPHDSCGISKELDLPFLESSQSLAITQTREHLAKGGVHLMLDLKFFLRPKGPLFPKKFPNNVRILNTATTKFRTMKVISEDR